MTRNTFCLAALVAALATSAAANGLKDQVVGTWELVSISANVNGEKIATFGDNPRGRQILAPSGHFVNLITAESLPLYAGANRLQGTPEEYAAIGKGSNAFYGSYEVDEATGTVTFNLEVSTFPNWEGVAQERQVTIEGDTMRYTNPMTAVGPGSVDVVWRRID